MGKPSKETVTKGHLEAAGAARNTGNSRDSSQDGHGTATGGDQQGNLSLREPGHPMSEVLRTYLSSLRDIGQTANIVLPHLSKWQLEELKKFRKKLDHFLGSPSNPQEIELESARDFVEVTTTLKKADQLRQSRALPVLARSLFMQTFCEFDAFTGNLLKTVYGSKTDLIKGISREISLSDLLEYSDIDSVKRAMLDKEIETFRRDSYVEQFAQLEKKFGLTLRKFSEWGEFVEFSQRRNIFTHNDGSVSEQYLNVCEREGYVFNARPKLGEALLVDGKYFSRAILVLSKVGYMLCHTLWSKLFPSECKSMHQSINDHLYAALEDQRWKTAAALGEFAISEPMRKNVSEIDYRIRLVNVAIALKFSGAEEQAKRLLNSLDWSASYRDFKLAICVLEDNFVEAVDIMKSIGRTGEIIAQPAYHSWPLFHKFRERPDFYVTYEEIYGEPYSIPADGVAASVSANVTIDSDVGNKKTMTQRGKKGPVIESVPTSERRRSKIKTTESVTPAEMKR